MLLAAADTLHPPFSEPHGPFEAFLFFIVRMFSHITLKACLHMNTSCAPCVDAGGGGWVIILRALCYHNDTRKDINYNFVFVLSVPADLKP